MKNKLNGYLVSVPVSWDDAMAFDSGAFERCLDRLIRERCDGVYIFGTSGEGYAVSDKEFEAIVKLFSRLTGGFPGFRQVACFGLSSEAVIYRCRIVEKAGIESVQVILPFWKELNEREVIRYFNDICGACPNLSFALYNNPRSKRRLTGAELENIAGIHENFIAAKSGPGNLFELYELITESPNIQHFVTEPGFNFCHQFRAVGLIPSSNYLFPSFIRSYFNAVRQGDHEMAEKFQSEIVRFFYDTALPLAAKGYIDGAIDKAYAKLGGYPVSLNMKSPYLTLTHEDFSWLETVVVSRSAGMEPEIMS